ncbi:hemerythrin domain-containing protein [Gangjinia marincola]|uniref:Hemerythrin domain-containing protein n=1 Tax=Gangjinia marincola TaxID=578463 RepID=A0ABN1MCZ4_9FLAO
MTIFEALRKDHDIQRELCDKLVNTSGKNDLRKNMFHKLKRELQYHADAEERFFYAPLIKEDLTQDKARHSISEHKDIDDLIEKLEETDMDSSAWLTYMKQLQHQVVHHLDEEEHEVFQLAGKALNESEKSSLSKKYNTYMEDVRDE